MFLFLACLSVFIRGFIRFFEKKIEKLFQACYNFFMPRRKQPLPHIGRKPLVVASLGEFSRLPADAKTAARAGAAAIEIRVDYFPRHCLRPEPLRGFLSRVRKAARRPLILTIRTRAEGGQLPHGFSEQDRLHLFRAALSKVEVVDVEVSANDINHHVVAEAHKRGRSVMLSYHDFKKIPSDKVLAGMVRKGSRMDADILKIAAKPHRASHVERFMDFCDRSSFKYRVFIPMGRLGIQSRINGFQYGSCLTYGYIRKPLAPGQVPVAELVKANIKG